MNPSSFIITYILDILLGDPRWLPHPIRMIGRLVRFLEKIFYPQNSSNKIKFIHGSLLTFIVILTSSLSVWLLLFITGKLSFILYTLVEIITGFYCLATKSLAFETLKVKKYLDQNDIANARKAVSMIVSRDTENLSPENVSRAAIESVAENLSDGIIAPMFYLVLGGPVAAMLYKTVSTLDSMIGYKNKKYEFFGKTAARFDDILGFVPARITGFILIPFAAFLRGFNVAGSFSICKRDRLKHPSPNAAHGEAAMAGALNIQLGGTNFHKGKISKKPLLGDNFKNIEPADIKNAVSIMYIASVCAALFALFCLFLIYSILDWA